MKHPEITIDKAAAEAIRQHGAATFPFECCGFLYGDESGDRRHIALALPANNSKLGDQRRRFEIDPLDYLKAEQYALQHNTHLLGIYHSHPDHPAIASPHDLAVAMPYFSYLIVSVMNGVATDLKSWRLQDDQPAFLEENIRLLTPDR